MRTSAKKEDKIKAIAKYFKSLKKKISESNGSGWIRPKPYDRSRKLN
ncbi:MAG: hypothetical protein QW303_07640 [Nitrososphaerota archaeon]